ncbi:PTS sugar transporter subunit IIA [Entomohabitans teleogrylli]|uniref:PTS sugar transporter subunit IIA n=1 Tax=Entomohabitans teleogrylli TaxID=1384589 RepID=UPI00073D56E8|nr:PTS sugar transporter subunit IIA [Entomohabitans teleogrylli]
MESTLFSAVQYAQSCEDWLQAVSLACQPLERQGIISTGYSAAIIRATQLIGPWYLLSPGFALPHARPQEGVFSTTSHLSLLRLEEAVFFPSEQPVGLIIVLAAASSRQHLEKIEQLVNWLDQENRLARILSTTSESALRQALCC